MSYFNRFQHSIRQAVVKTETARRPAVIATQAEAFAEAHRRTRNEDANLSAAGVKPMHPDEYKHRFNAHLADVTAEVSTQKPSGQFMDAAPSPRDDGTGNSNTKNPTTNTRAPGPRNDGTGSVPPPMAGRVRKSVYKADASGPLNLATIFSPVRHPK
jgi:hypothetical protein